MRDRPPRSSRPPHPVSAWEPVAAEITQPLWPVVDPDEAVADARRVLAEYRPAPDEQLLRRVLAALHRL